MGGGHGCLLLRATMAGAGISPEHRAERRVVRYVVALHSHWHA
ncbi:Hypothetical protein A7982_02423 [Minicystis rosea]|nr:Hypothetical protein A7982_02423 [Minicystis rosea]